MGVSYNNHSKDNMGIVVVNWFVDIFYNIDLVVIEAWNRIYRMGHLLIPKKNYRKFGLAKNASYTS